MHRQEEPMDMSTVARLPLWIGGRATPARRTRYGELSESVDSDADSFSMRQPGVHCSGITPFNFPAMVPMWMFPIAIACGNTFILNPSERDPSMSLKMAELAKHSALPDGVLNVVH